jgi:type II secretory pathway pseudopilin PulG
MQRQRKPFAGFTLLELVIATGIFLIICAAMFELLNLAQIKYSSESQITGAYQDVRLALDQVVRDVNTSGFPSLDMFSVQPSVTKFASNPLAWSPSYPVTPCQIGTGGGGTCATPGDYDLILETKLPTDNFVSWIWYHYDPATLTLFREVVPKNAGDPLAAVTGAGTQTPLVRNVVNVPGGLMGQITTTYPSMFPAGQPVPVFQYECDPPVGSSGGTVPCPNAAGNNSPQFVRDVDVTLIVMTQQKDLQTQTLKLVELFGRGHRANPTATD